MVVIDVPIDAIYIQLDERGEPINPRGPVTDTTDLQKSIAAQGLIQPLEVRWMENATATAYWLRHGHRRLTAVRELGWSKVPCIVYGKEATQADDILNMLAGDVSQSYPPLYLARAFARLVAQGVQMKEIASAWGQTADAVSAHIQLLDAHPDAQQAVVDGRMGISAFARVKHLPQEEQAAVVASVKPDANISTRTVMNYMKERRQEEAGAESPFADNAPFRSVAHTAKSHYNVALQALAQAVSSLPDEFEQWPVDVQLLHCELVEALAAIRSLDAGNPFRVSEMIVEA